jgi:hypothetical protein
LSPIAKAGSAVTETPALLAFAAFLAQAREPAVVDRRAVGAAAMAASLIGAALTEFNAWLHDDGGGSASDGGDDVGVTGPRRRFPRETTSPVSGLRRCGR